MNIEKIGQPIKAESLEEHEKFVQEKLIRIQSEYVDRVFSKSIKPFESPENSHFDDFGYLLDRYTDILDYLISYYTKQEENKGIEFSSDACEKKEEEFKNSIIQFHKEDSAHWIEKTMQLLTEERKKSEIITVNITSRNESVLTEKKMRGTVGIIDFNLQQRRDNEFKDTGLNISPVDYCMAIHVDPLYKKVIKNEGKNIFSSNSLEKLAIEIVDRFPETKIITARSWLVNTPIGKRIGFTTYDAKKNRFLKGAFWGQFLNDTGQIDTDRVNKFLETGHPPYTVAEGFMRTEDFLKKYLPEEKRGKIILKEVNQEFSDEMKKEEDVLKEIGNNWDTCTEDDIKNVISKSVILKKFTEQESGKKFLEFFLQMKREKKPKEFVNKELTSKFSQPLDTFFRSMMFINKEIFID